MHFAPSNRNREFASGYDMHAMYGTGPPGLRNALECVVVRQRDGVESNLGSA